MAILTKSGRIVIAESIAARPIHLAWGTGDGSWLVAPNESSDASGLIAEVGRRIASDVGFVTPDPTGDIILPTGTYKRSATPTNHLFVVTNFDFADGGSSVIREVAIFAGSTIVSGLPAGQKYFTPNQISTPGRLLHLENLAPIFRSPAIRENFEQVITF